VQTTELALPGILDVGSADPFIAGKRQQLALSLAWSPRRSRVAARQIQLRRHDAQTAIVAVGHLGRLRLGGTMS
jgi:hypothetical protein